nr:unnamed protein product [Digitaria exilis]
MINHPGSSSKDFGVIFLKLHASLERLHLQTQRRADIVHQVPTVVRLQAAVRGFLVRRQAQVLRATRRTEHEQMEAAKRQHAISSRGVRLKAAQLQSLPTARAQPREGVKGHPKAAVAVRLQSVEQRHAARTSWDLMLGADFAVARMEEMAAQVGIPLVVASSQWTAPSASRASTTAVCGRPCQHPESAAPHRRPSRGDLYRLRQAMRISIY